MDDNELRVITRVEEKRPVLNEPTVTEKAKDRDDRSLSLSIEDIRNSTSQHTVTHMLYRNSSDMAAFGGTLRRSTVHAEVLAQTHRAGWAGH
eukprot:1184070-Prorocentrum_minimum.AAC.3